MEANRQIASATSRYNSFSSGFVGYALDSGLADRLFPSDLEAQKEHLPTCDFC